MQQYIWAVNRRTMDHQEQILQVLREQKIVFANPEAERSFLAAAADKTSEGRSFYIPISFQFNTTPELAFPPIHFVDQKSSSSSDANKIER